MPHLRTRASGPLPKKISRPRVKRAIEAFGAEVRRKREVRRLSRAQLAEAVGLTATTIRNIECARNEPFFENALRLAASLDIPLDDFRAQSG
jgi:transcriptional regulator with XRE-family HTH domain